MLFNIICIILSMLSTFYFTYTYYDEFYVTDTKLLYFLCLMGLVIAFVLTIGGIKTGKRVTKLVFLFTPYAILYCITYNVLFAAACFVFLTLTAIILPHKSYYYKIEFDAQNNISYNLCSVKKTFSRLYHRWACILSAGFSVLFVFTCIFTTPTTIWQLRFFPNNLAEKPIITSLVFPSGKVTSTAWYDENALLVTEFFDIPAPNGTLSPCKDAGMLPGDIITHINSQPAYESDFITKGATASSVTLDVLRSKPDGTSESLVFTVTPAYSTDEERYLIGITFYTSAMVATSVQTVSFIYPHTGYFAATAHSSEEVYATDSDILGILINAKSTGRDDEGLIVKPTNEVFGTILYTNDYGAFGVMAEPNKEMLPIAKKSEIKYGKAVLRSDFEGKEEKEYDVFVTGTYRIDSRDVICFIVTDERIKNAGGITRGMSGSPIIQNGKIIGALSNMDQGGYSAYATYAYDMAHELFKASQRFAK